MPSTLPVSSAFSDIRRRGDSLSIPSMQALSAVLHVSASRPIRDVQAPPADA